MAGSSLRSTRRSARNGESAGDNNSTVKSETLSATESVGEISISLSPLDSSTNIGVVESTEDVSSESSGSSSSRKSSTSSSESSSVTSEESLNKTKDELIQTARDLDSQLKDLMKM